MAKSEAEVSAEFVALMSPYFRLYPEVVMMHPTKGRIRIDFVGQPTCGRWQGNFGFELKHGAIGDGNFSKWSNALAQCIDYAQSRIISDKIGGEEWFGKTLKYVFIYPCTFKIWQHVQPDDDKQHQWARGQVRLAGKFGVGAIEFDSGKNDWVFTLGAEAAFWLKQGPTNLGLKHAVGERIGADR